MSKKKDMHADLFKEEVKPNQSQDFASMFERSLGLTENKLRVGDKFSAEILSIGKEESFVSTGTSVDGIIFNADLLNEEKVLQYKVGDFIEVVVLRVKDGEIRVTRKGSKSSPVDLDSLEDAFDMELPIEGKVTEVVNGGYRVSIQGQSAFCPFSQLDTKPISDPASLVGKKFDFLITQFDSRKKNIVVSRRRLLDLQKSENEGVWIEKYKVGDLIQGVVTRTEQYGAFVDLGDGVEGLVHVSEIGFIRLKHASEGVRVGENIQVKVLKISEEDSRLRISLSIKAAGGVGDPWLQVPQTYPVGSIVDGTVDKKEVFGMFVVLTPGINGLLPKSKWRDSLDAQNYENLKKGDVVKVRVDEIKFEERKISLGLPTEVDDESWKQHQKSQSMGSFAAAFAVANSKK
ncbi:MAG: S1 RNA-binding domain-containing protein [Pseudobdellovibrionaceae bacterium]